MLEFNNFESIQIGLASSDKIREWSMGEVKSPKQSIIEHSSQKGWLVFERIFGPQKDWNAITENTNVFGIKV